MVHRRPGPERRDRDRSFPPHALGVGITSPGAVPAPAARSPVRRYEEPPSLETFLLEHFARSSPALLVGGCACWPARTGWRDPEFLRDVAGVRTVPVEYGPDYLHPEWTQELTTVATLLRRDIRQTRAGSAAGRNRVPRTARTIRSNSRAQIGRAHAGLLRTERERDGIASGGRRRGWRGILGGTTGGNERLARPGRDRLAATHRDSHHGLLSQVLGRKYVRLYAPRHERAMYPRDVAKESNASSVDLAAERGRAAVQGDSAGVSRIRQGAFSRHVILEEGDQLYVPPEWWHYVQSMTSSFSVSHWWG